MVPGRRHIFNSDSEEPHFTWPDRIAGELILNQLSTAVRNTNKRLLDAGHHRAVSVVKIYLRCGFAHSSFAVVCDDAVHIHVVHIQNSALAELDAAEV